MLKILRERAVLLDSQYTQYEEEIIRLTERLNKDVELLGFSTTDLHDAKTYLNDDGNLINFERKEGQKRGRPVRARRTLEETPHFTILREEKKRKNE